MPSEEKKMTEKEFQVWVAALSARLSAYAVIGETGAGYRSKQFFWQTEEAAYSATEAVYLFRAEEKELSQKRKTRQAKKR